MTDAARSLDEAAFVALGSNLSLGRASCVEVLAQAFDAMGAAGVAVRRRSRPWRSAAWPDLRQPAFVNAVAEVETALSPEALLEVLHGIEAAFGRRRGAANAARTLDLDLIAHGRRVQIGPPALPHPRAAERRFVMGPLAEIAPGWRDPATGRTARELAALSPVGRDAAPAGDWP